MHSTKSEQKHGRFHKTSTTSKLHCILHQGVNTRIWLDMEMSN